MIDKDFFKGIKIALGFIFTLSLFSIIFAVGFHIADEILPGTFVGDYVFNGSVGIGDLYNNHKFSILDNQNYSLDLMNQSRTFSLYHSGGGGLLFYPHNAIGTATNSNPTWFINSHAYENIVIGAGQSGVYNESNAIHFNYDGNVGIGTVTPQRKLDVNGDITGNKYFFNYGVGPSHLYVNDNGCTVGGVQVATHNGNELCFVG